MVLLLQEVVPIKGRCLCQRRQELFCRRHGTEALLDGTEPCILQVVGQKNCEATIRPTLADHQCHDPKLEPVPGLGDVARPAITSRGGTIVKRSHASMRTTSPSNIWNLDPLLPRPSFNSKTPIVQKKNN